MARTVRRPPSGKSGRQNHKGAVNSAAEASPGADGPDRLLYRCPFCGKSANATYKLGNGGFLRWFVGCFTPACEGRDLPALADALGLDPAAEPDEVAAAIRDRGLPVKRRQDPLPSGASAWGWHMALLGPDGARGRAYLARRGVTLAEVRSNMVGWDGSRLTFPMFAADGMEPLAFKRRAPNDRAQMMSLRGTFAWPLYPSPDTGSARSHGWVLLVAGELDALAARSAGLPASSVTLGAGHWEDRWTDLLRGLGVVVAFDNNEGEQARAVVARLRAAGIAAHRLDLRDLGLTTPKGDVSDYLAGGGDPAKLRRPRRVTRRRIRRAA